MGVSGMERRQRRLETRARNTRGYGWYAVADLEAGVMHGGVTNTERGQGDKGGDTWSPQGRQERACGERARREREKK